MNHILQLSPQQQYHHPKSSNNRIMLLWQSPIMHQPNSHSCRRNKLQYRSCTHSSRSSNKTATAIHLLNKVLR